MAFVVKRIRWFRLLSVALSFVSLASLYSPTISAQTSAELRATRAFNAARKLGPPELYAFLRPMPKGAELHYHLGGGIYAETFLSEAIEQNICIDPVAARFVPPFAGATKANPCAPGAITAAAASADQKLYDRMIDVLSMRSFVPYAGMSGHDQFFAGNRANGPTDLGEWLAIATLRAAGQNEQYLELMANPAFTKPLELSARLAWPTDAATSITREQLAKLRDQLLAGGLRDEIPSGRRQMDEAETRQRTLEDCSGKRAGSAACRMKIHYIYNVGRGAAPAQVFAATLMGFEFNTADPRFVGFNFGSAEDGLISMRDYHLHMQMLDYLHSIYPNVNITLHAGELAPGLVPPEGLRFHIREAIELGHAQRIGHGLDVFYEEDAPGLLKEMADKHIMVEINLTSNYLIAGIRGAQHPLNGYRAAHVPVSLSTDDEGALRTDLTQQYEVAADEQSLGYLDLKQMARTSFEHAFLRGESLWAAADDFRRRKPVCAAAITATAQPSASCQAFLNTSERAAQQWEFEQRFARFEAAIP